nr:uncharacterized protein LOC105849201 isoform X1 [Hydra vulgaris]
MANYSKNVLDALTEIESTQPITVPSTSAIRVTSSAPTITIPCVQPSAVESTQPITATFTCSTNVPSTSAICVPGVQPSAVRKNYICIIEVKISVSCNRNLFKEGWILQLAFCNVVGYDWAGRGAFGVAHVPSLMSTYTPLVYAVKFEAEAVVPFCSKKDGWLFWPTCVHAMKATYNNFPIVDSCNKLRLKRVKVTGDKEVCAGFNFTTSEDS